MRFCLLGLLLISLPVWADWYPVEVNADGKLVRYQPLAAAERPWRLCALLPHGKDQFWWGVAWGLDQEARRQGVKLGIYQAGDYGNLARQTAQFDECLHKKADAILLAAVDGLALRPQLEAAQSAGIPVIDLVNGIDLPQIAAHARSSTREMARQATQFIVQQSATRPVRIAWLPGPKGATWAEEANRGAREAVQGTAAVLLPPLYGAPEMTAQMNLVRTAVKAKPAPDYLLLNAVAAEAAARLFQAQPELRIPIVAYYSNPGVLAGLQQGKIVAAVANAPVVEARIAVDLAVRHLQGKRVGHDISPVVTLLVPESLAGFDRRRLQAPDRQWLILRPLPD